MPSLEYQRTYAFKHRHENPILYMITKARKNAKKSGLEFNLKSEELTMPEVCPILGIPLKIGDGERMYGSPSLDRFDSSKGYTKDNVNIISWRANHLKNNGTAEEFRKIAEWMTNKETGIAPLASKP